MKTIYSNTYVISCVLLILSLSGCGGSSTGVATQSSLVISTQTQSSSSASSQSKSNGIAIAPSRAVAIDSALPDEITRLTIVISDTNENTISSSTITNLDNNVLLAVEPNIPLIIFVSAFSGSEQLYQGTLEVSPLAINESRFVAVTVQQAISVIIEPSALEVTRGQSISLNPNIDGLIDSSVSYTVNGIVGGNDSVGTINTDGVYTSPSNLTQDTTVTLSITPTQAPSFAETVDVLVIADPPVIDPTIDPLILSAPTQAGIKTIRMDWNDIGASFYRLTVNPDGVSGFTTVPGKNELRGTSTTIEVPVHMTDWVNAIYRLEAFTASGSLPSLTSSSNEISITKLMIASIGQLTASNGDQGDLFSASISLSMDGNTLAIGAPNESSAATSISTQGQGEEDNSAIAAGAVYLFIRIENTWTQQAYIKADNAEAFDLFGFSVSLSEDGNTLAVGARDEDSNATGVNENSGPTNNSSTDSGAAYVYVRTGSSWSQQAYVKASNTKDGHEFGFSLALSADGDILAVGAPFAGGANENSSGSSGVVYMFLRKGSTWAQFDLVGATDGDAGDQFGFIGLSADGTTLAVGAPGEDSASTGTDTSLEDELDNSAQDTGAVYIFNREEDGQWNQRAYLKASNSGAGDEFGRIALSSDGQTLAVGAPGEDSSAEGINDDLQKDNSSESSGAVYIFTNNDGFWIQQAYVKASNSEPGDLFGAALSLSEKGETLAINATSEDSSANGVSLNGNGEDLNNKPGEGAVYVFRFSSSNWQQQSYVKAPIASETTSIFGTPNLSADGQTLITGGIGISAERGAVFIY